MQNSRLVYSTDGGKVDQSRKTADTRSVNQDGIARIQRETKGRKGKGVSIITGLDQNADELKALCTVLKKKCGCGGAAKAGTIELQTAQWIKFSNYSTSRVSNPKWLVASTNPISQQNNNHNKQRREFEWKSYQSQT